MKRVIDILIAAVIAALIVLLVLFALAEPMPAAMKPTAAKSAACWRAV